MHTFHMLPHYGLQEMPVWLSQSCCCLQSHQELLCLSIKTDKPLPSQKKKCCLKPATAAPCQPVDWDVRHYAFFTIEVICSCW